MNQSVDNLVKEAAKWAIDEAEKGRDKQEIISELAGETTEAKQA